MKKFERFPEEDARVHAPQASYQENQTRTTLKNPGYLTYIVSEQGTNLYNIAKKFGVDYDKLKALNQRRDDLDPLHLSPGDVVYIPTIEYVVQKGDTAESISQKVYGAPSHAGEIRTYNDGKLLVLQKIVLVDRSLDVYDFQKGSIASPRRLHTAEKGESLTEIVQGYYPKAGTETIQRIVQDLGQQHQLNKITSEDLPHAISLCIPVVEGQEFAETPALKNNRTEELEEVTVLALGWWHLMRIRGLAKKYEGKTAKWLQNAVSGTIQQIKTEMILMLRSFNTSEQALLRKDQFHINENSLFGIVLNEARDKSTLEVLCAALDADELARGIGYFDPGVYSLEQKFKLLEKTGDTHIEYQLLRPMLLSDPSGRGEKIDNALRKNYGPDKKIAVSELLNPNISRTTSRKKDVAFYDDEREGTELNLGADELKTMQHIADRDYLYTLQEDYGKTGVFSPNRAKRRKNLNKEAQSMGYKDRDAFETDIEKRKKKYLPIFHKMALKVAFDMLNKSEQAILRQSDQILKKDAGTNIKNTLKKHQGAYEVWKKNNDRLQNELSRLKMLSGGNANRVSLSPLGRALFGFNTDVAKAQKLMQEVQEQQKDLREKLGREQPLLYDPELKLEDLYEDYVEGDESNEEIEEFFRKQLVKKYANIDRTRQNLREDPDLVWKFDGVLRMAKLRTNVFQAGVLDKMVDQKAASVKKTDTYISTGLAAFSIGLAIVSMGTLSGPAAIIVGGLAVATSAADFYLTYKDYSQKSPASDTHIDPKNKLSSEKPSVIWVIASAAGLLGDALTIAKLSNKVSQLARMGDTALGNLNNRAGYLYQQIKKAKAPLMQGVDNLKVADNFADLINFMRSAYRVRKYLMQKFLKEAGFVNLDDMNLAIARVIEDNAEAIRAGTLADDILEKSYFRMIQQQTVIRRGGSVVTKIAGTGSNASGLEDLVKKIAENTGLSDKAKTAFATMMGKVGGSKKISAAMAGEIGDIVVDLFKINPHLLENWIGILTAGSKRVKDPAAFLKTARDVSRLDVVVQNPQVLQTIGEILQKGTTKVKAAFVRDMSDIVRYIDGGSVPLLQNTDFLKELLVKPDLQKFLRHNMDDPTRIGQLWETYWGHNHSSFGDFIKAEEKTRLAGITKVKGGYPTNSREFAGRTFHFDLEKNRVMYDRIMAEKDLVERAKKLNKFRELSRKYPNGVKFKPEGFPDFEPYTYIDKSSRVKGRIKLDKLNPGDGGSGKDITEADRKMKTLLTRNRSTLKWTEARKLNPPYTWHHIEGTTELVAIPTEIHQEVRHFGGRSTR